MGRNHYHKCFHVSDLRTRRDQNEPYICLGIAGSKMMVILCPLCHSLVKRGEEVEISYIGKRSKTRMVKKHETKKKIKKYPSTFEFIFFEVMTV